jgi:acetoin utilization protein AcuB
MTIPKEMISHNIVCINKDASLLEADRLMKEKRIRHLPVIDKDNRIVGIISKRDLIYLDEMSEVAVEWLMRSPVISVDRNESLRSVTAKFLERKISCVLVTDETEHKIGILTTDDLLGHLFHLLEKEESTQESALGASKLLKIGELAQKIADTGI